MITSPKVVLKTRSWSPLAARAWTILNNWRWNSPLATGFTTSVRPAVIAVTTRATASQEDRDQKRHGQGVGEKGRKHVDEELDDKVERHAFRDDQVGQVVDPVDDEEECEEGAAER